MKYECLFLQAVAFNFARSLLSDGEFTLLLSLSNFFDVGFLVFIDNGIVSRVPIELIKWSSKNNLPSTVVTGDRLEKILAGKYAADELFRKKTMFAAKERLTLGKFLNLIENPKAIVWSLFVEPLDVTSDEVYIPCNSQVLLILSEKHGTSIYELYHPGQNVSLIRKSFGFVTADGIANFPDRNAFQSGKLNFSDVVLKIGIQNLDHLCRGTMRDYMYAMINCFHYILIEIMAEKLNFRIDYIEFNEEENIFVYPNGSYAGYFKMILDNVVDISVASFVVTEARLVQFDFAWPTFVLETMMYLNENTAAFSLGKEMPFATRVWGVIIVLILLIGGSLYATDFCNRSLRSGNANRSLVYSVLEVMELMCGQGSCDVPSSVASRAVYATTIFTYMLLFYYYSATVASFLTIDYPRLPFQDLEGFFENGQYKILAIAEGFAIYFLKFEMSRDQIKASQFFVKDEELPANVSEGAHHLCGGSHLALVELKENLRNVGKFDCVITPIPSAIFDQYFGFALPKRSQYVDYIKMVLRQMVEVGIITRMQYSVTRFYNARERQNSANYEAVAVEKIVTPLTIVIIGIFLSTIILFAETWKYKQEKRERKKKLLMIGSKRRKTLNQHFSLNLNQQSFRTGVCPTGHNPS